jgi:hypothetical protein
MSPIRESLDPVRAALRAAAGLDRVRAEHAIDAAVSAGLVHALVAEARRQRVLGMIAPRLIADPRADEALRRDLERRGIGQAAHRLRILEDLRTLGATLDAADVPWLVVKGPVVAQLLYDPPELRSYQDLDVVLPRDAFPRALAAMEQAGAELLDRNWSLISREGRGQLHLVLRLGTVADVHWHLLNRQQVRRSFAVSMPGAFARARWVDLGGIPVRTLDPADTLVHLALHAALGGADRLAWFADVTRSVAVDAPPWAEVIRRASDWRAGPPVAAVLARARDVVGADVPEAAIHALDPSPLRRRLGTELDARWPADGAHSPRAMVALWPQVLRHGTWATAGAALRRVARPIENAMLHVFGEPGLDEGERTGAILKPSGGPTGRDRYLRDISLPEDR